MGATSSSPQLSPRIKPYTKTYDVIDFKTSTAYMPYKYNTVGGKYMNFEPTTAEDVAEMMWYQFKRSNPVFFMQDEIKRKITGGEIITFNRAEMKGVCDGIYDIWLRVCKNLNEFSIDIEGVGTVYSVKFEKTKMNGDVHIPLYIETSGQDKPVDSIMFEKLHTNVHVSFIPSPVFIHNRVTFRVNEGAEAMFCASTLYLDIEKRRELIHNDVFFQINGSQFFYPKMSLGYFQTPNPNTKHFQVKLVNPKRKECSPQ